MDYAVTSTMPRASKPKKTDTVDEPAPEVPVVQETEPVAKPAQAPRKGGRRAPKRPYKRMELGKLQKNVELYNARMRVSSDRMSIAKQRFEKAERKYAFHSSKVAAFETEASFRAAAAAAAAEEAEEAE